MKDVEKKYSTNYYHYDLPAEKIAPKPLSKRLDSKLLVLNRKNGEMTDSRFSDLKNYLKKGDLLVFNNTKVIKARLFGKKESGGKVEIFLVRPACEDTNAFDVSENTWLALVNPSKAIKPGKRFDIGDVFAKVIERMGNGQALLEFSAKNAEKLDFEKFLNSQGNIPLPPYINRRRESEDYKKSPFLEDDKRYQTVYAKDSGSVAAPTAGLHFNKQFIDTLIKAGIETAHITLHVGPGTFKPIKTDDIRSHKMDKEWFSVEKKDFDRIKKAKSEGRRVVAVGTTSVRVLESIFKSENQKLMGWTDLYIYPGFDFKIVDSMITNFHLPGSTLILLVSALAKAEQILKTYEFAKNNDYRFYSYGDAMLIV